MQHNTHVHPSGHVQKDFPSPRHYRLKMMSRLAGLHACRYDAKRTAFPAPFSSDIWLLTLFAILCPSSIYDGVLPTNLCFNSRATKNILVSFFKKEIEIG